MRNLARIVFVGAIGTGFLAGCTPGPMPPMFGPGGMEILLFVLIAALGYFIWHKITVINSKLDSLEDEIRKIKNEKGGNHD